MAAGVVEVPKRAPGASGACEMCYLWGHCSGVSMLHVGVLFCIPYLSLAEQKVCFLGKGLEVPSARDHKLSRSGLYVKPLQQASNIP